MTNELITDEKALLAKAASNALEYVNEGEVVEEGVFANFIKDNDKEFLVAGFGEVPLNELSFRLLYIKSGYSYYKNDQYYWCNEDDTRGKEADIAICAILVEGEYVLRVVRTLQGTTNFTRGMNSKNLKVAEELSGSVAQGKPYLFASFGVTAKLRKGKESGLNYVNAKAKSLKRDTEELKNFWSFVASEEFAEELASCQEVLKGHLERKEV